MLSMFLQCSVVDNNIIEIHHRELIQVVMKDVNRQSADVIEALVKPNGMTKTQMHHIELHSWLHLPEQCELDSNLPLTTTLKSN